MLKKLRTLGALEPFVSQPQNKIHIAEVARTINEPEITVRLWLKDLEEQGIVKKSYQGRMCSYELNKNRPLLTSYLSIVEKDKVIRKGNKEILFKELVRLTEPLAPIIVVFGSSVISLKDARDIDLLVVGGEKKLFEEVGDKINKKIHSIHVSSLDKVSQALKNEILKKHLIIKGVEEVTRWLQW